MLEAQRHVRMLWVPVAFGSGIGVYLGLRNEPETYVVLALAILGVLLLAASFRLNFFVALIAIALLGFAHADWRTARIDAPTLGWYYWGPIEGRVIAIDRSTSNAPRVTLDKVYLPRISSEKMPERVRFSMHGFIGDGVLEAGAQIAAQGRLGPPGAPVEPGGFDFRKYAYFRQLGAVGYVRDPVLVIGPRNMHGMSTRLLAFRKHVADIIRANMSTETGAFAAAILTGDRSAIDPEHLIDLRASNLAHLLAISGLHMGLLTGIVFATIRCGLAFFPRLALRLPVKKIAAIAALAAGFGYLAISGASVATERAFIMAAVVLIAVMLDRPALTLRAVGIAAMIVLLRAPESLAEAGFQMSFAATTALVAGFNELRKISWWQGLNHTRLKHFKPVMVIIFTSAVAGLATAPFSAFHFNQTSQFGLLANVLAVPMMGLIVMPAAVLTLCLWPLGLASFGFWLMDRGIAYILMIADWVAGLEGVLRLVSSGPGFVLTMIAMGGLYLLLWQGRMRIVGFVPIIAALQIWGEAERPDILISDDGRLVGVLDQGGRILNLPRGHGFAAETWLENDGDKATQEIAANRDGMDRSRQVTRANIAGFGTLVWLNSKQASSDECADNVLIIAPKWERSPNGPCIFIGKEAVEKNGSIAVWVRDDGQLQVQGAHTLSGKRPWAE